MKKLIIINILYFIFTSLFIAANAGEIKDKCQNAELSNLEFRDCLINEILKD
jgi:hypothetical protein